MNNMAEFIAVAKYWREWPNPAWICAVWNNEDLNQVTWEQRVMEGDPRFNASQNIPNVPYHRFAELIGLKGINIHESGGVARAWEEALRSHGPVVPQLKTDPNVPPLPPHITLEQGKHFASALLKVDPEESCIIAGAAKQRVATIRPGGDSKRQVKTPLAAWPAAAF